MNDIGKTTAGHILKEQPVDAPEPTSDNTRKHGSIDKPFHCAFKDVARLMKVAEDQTEFEREVALATDWHNEYRPTKRSAAKRRMTIERAHASLKQECLDKIIFFAHRSLRNAVGQFLSYYHAERNHPGLGNELIEPNEGVGQTDGDVQCRERLGGLLKYYYHDAA